MRALTVPNQQSHLINQLAISEIPIPNPAPEEVLIKVHATGLNPVDYKIVKNGIADWAYPHVLGLDVAGEVVATGDQVNGFQVGDRVSGHSNLHQNGCFAEYVAVPSYQLAKIPDNVSYEQAAALLCGALTAYTAINRKPNLTNVHNILIHAGAGSVGSLAIQFAKLRHLKVFTTVSSGKVDFVKQLHPDAIINYRTEDVDQKVMALTHDQGVDLIVNTVGKEESTRDLHRLAYNGTLITIVDIPDIDPNLLFERALNVETVNLGGAHLSNNAVQKADLSKMNAEVLQLMSQHEIDPLIDQVLPFDQIQVDLSMIKKHAVKGKLVVKID